MLVTEKTSQELCIDELIIIFKNNYCKDENFKKELSSILLLKTGSDNLGALCRMIIDDFLKCHNNITISESKIIKKELQAKT